VLFSVCASIFIVLFSSFYLFDEIKYEEQKNDLIKHQKFITQSQAIIIPPHIVDRDEERVTLILSGILSNPTIIGVTVYGQDGKALYRFGKFESDTYQIFKASHDITNFDGSRIRQVGRLETIATDRYIVENFRERREFYGLMFLVLFFAMVLATYASIHLVVAIPLKRLIAAIKQQRAGEPISVNWSSRDEIGLLITEYRYLQERQFRSQSQLRDELERSEQISADLRLMRDAADQANKAKSEFLATMGHELRTPLNAIIGFSEVIKSEVFGPVGEHRYVEYSRDINESGTHLLSLINDILDMSKMEAGEMAAIDEPFHFIEAVEPSIRLIARAATQGKIDLTTRIPDDLPAFMGDARMIKQILINLLSNAVKFTPENGKVTLSASADKDGFLISVADTGIGIPPEKIEKVLQPFGQVDSSLARKYEGAGLGLPLVRAMVDLQGGVLSIDSAVGEGTRVDIRFPPTRIHLGTRLPIEAERIA